MKKYVMTIMSLLFAIVTACSENESVNVEPQCGFYVPDSDEAVESIGMAGLGMEKMVQIKSNAEWSVSSDADWLALSNVSGGPTDTEASAMYLKLTAARHEGQESRTACVTLKAGSAVKKLSVVQTGMAGLDASGWELAATCVNNMKFGLNIGNTLDANGTWVSGTLPSDFETCWGNPVITRELVHTMAAAGFKAVRLPVTWWQNIGEDGTVRKSWMDRVEEVVNYILDEGMYCVLNVHHDTGGSESSWLRADINNIDGIESRFISLWKQIAVRFQNYGDKLIFEGYNEMLDGNLNWSTTDASGYTAHNRLAQAFVTTVRETGGNNAKRNLLVNTYSADPMEGNINAFVVPNDIADNHLIAGVHIYKPDSFTSPGENTESPLWTKDCEKELTDVLNGVVNRFVKRGIPVVVGEFGASNSVAGTERVKYVGFFKSACVERGIGGFYWFDIIDRHNYTWTEPQIKNLLID